ncbi:hypothetical protein EYA81_08460 [Bacteroides sp. A1C1]|nr:hypothetical protein EYA81_08460 [Bacteroides sp. A1C1]
MHFDTPSFSKHFKEEFNISPSEFIRQQAE